MDETPPFRGFFMPPIPKIDLLETLEEGILPDHRVEDLVERLTPAQRIFLAGLGRGLSPLEAARRAGWEGTAAENIARAYMEAHPVVSPLAAHVLCLRRLASLGEEEAGPAEGGTVH
jgi:hypothetical protein